MKRYLKQKKEKERKCVAAIRKRQKDNREVDEELLWQYREKEKKRKALQRLKKGWIEE